jgi:hypothetical protein
MKGRVSRWLASSDVPIEKVPADELYAAAIWEYARRSRRLCALSDLLHKQYLGGKDYTPPMRELASLGGRNALQFVGMVQNVAVNLNYRPLLECTPWLSIPDELRDRVKSHAERPRGAFAPWGNGELVKLCMDPGRTQHVIAVCIDWEAGIPAILEDLQAILKDLPKPPTTRLRRESGRLSAPADFGTTALGALNTLRRWHAAGENPKCGNLDRDSIL